MEYVLWHKLLPSDRLFHAIEAWIEDHHLGTGANMQILPADVPPKTPPYDSFEHGIKEDCHIGFLACYVDASGKEVAKNFSLPLGSFADWNDVNQLRERVEKLRKKWAFSSAG